MKSFLIAISLVCSCSAWAQFYTGTVGTSTGGAARAAVNPGESSIVNPATLTELKNYYGSFSAGWGDHPIEGGLTQYAALLADGSDDKMFPGEFSFVQKRLALSSGLTTTQQDFQIGAGFAPGQTYSFGLSFHHLIYTDNIGGGYAQNNIHIGTLWYVLPNFDVSFVAYDILGGDNSVPQAYQTVATYAFGSQYSIGKTFAFRADFTRPDKFNNNQGINTMLGFETYFRQDFAFRAGWQWHEAGFEEKLLTAGLGYKGPKLSFDYAFEQDILQSSYTRQFIDMWLPF